MVDTDKLVFKYKGKSPDEILASLMFLFLQIK